MHTVHFVGKNSLGEKISLMQDIATDISLVFNWGKTVDLLILDIGTNDLNNDSNFPPRSLSLVLMDLVERLLGSGVHHLLVSEILFRRGRHAVCWNDPPSRERVSGKGPPDQQPPEDQGWGQPRNGLPTCQGAPQRLAAAPRQGRCPHERDLLADIRQEL